MGARRPVAAVVALVTAAVLLSGCADAAQDEADARAARGLDEPLPSAGTGDTSGSGAGSGSVEDGGSAGAVVGAEYAVPAPGPREDRLYSADILLTSADTLTDDAVAEVRDLDGVEAAARISVGQVSMENAIYSVAAVDPATYRLFTKADSADLQAQWDRVAGGEAAVRPELKKELPLDDTGSLALGSGEEKVDVHVGAWAPQVQQVDLVVNAKRGEQLGLVPGNALLVSTGETAPDSLRGPLQRTASADEVSVQNLDVVAQFGLDPDAFENVVPVGAFADAVGTFRYTAAGGGRINPDPAWVASHISTQQVPILGSVTCDNDLFPQLRAALAEVVELGLASKINPGEYAGCYYPRFIAGSTSLSNHSFGLALDLNTPGNGRGTVGEMDRGVVAVFKKWGFAWGGDWSYTDPMHFELSRIVEPG